jgi:hypothetical protein
VHPLNSAALKDSIAEIDLTVSMSNFRDRTSRALSRRGSNSHDDDDDDDDDGLELADESFASRGKDSFKGGLESGDEGAGDDGEGGGFTTASDWRKMSEEEWLFESFAVFQGDVTQELDKQSLVLPILGLYAELYASAEALQETASFFGAQCTPPSNPSYYLRPGKDET